MSKPACLLFSALLLSACHALSAELHSMREHYPLGRAHAVALVQYCAAAADAQVLLFHPHENETTAKHTALAGLAARGRGCLLALEHNGRRRITLDSDSGQADFDPNRIYTAAGRAATLARSGNHSPAAAAVTAAFAEHLLTRHLNPAPFVVALHNNSDGGVDIHSYRDGLPGDDSADVYVNPERDPDDYFYTIDRRAFEFFKARGFNAVLQNNASVRDDGSLSVYAARRGSGYLNIEAQHGHAAEQAEMLRAVWDYLAAF